jgi:hypothetical protein
MLDCRTRHFGRRRLDRGYAERYRLQSCDGPLALGKCQFSASYKKRNCTCLLYQVHYHSVAADQHASQPRLSFLSRQCSLVRLVYYAAEEHLEALTASVKELVPGRTVPPNPMSPPSGIKNSGKDALQVSHGRTLRILKNVVIATGLFAVASLAAFWPWQTEHEESLEKSNLQPMHPGPSASLDSLPQAPGDASEGKSAYTYTRFGLWSASKTGPTPSVQQGRQDTTSSTLDTQPGSAMPLSPSDDQKPVGEGERLGALNTASARSVQEETTRISSRRQWRHAKSRSKSHSRRDSKSQGLRFADIKSRLRRLWHQIVARSK